MKPANPRRDPSGSSTMIVIAIAWTLGVAAVLAARFRGEWSAFRTFHRALSELGVPDAARNFDGLLIFVAASLLGAWLACRFVGGTVGSHLGLTQGRRGWWPMVLVALVPMVIGGAVLLVMRGGIPEESTSPWPRVIRGVIRAPIMEEVLYRGLLVGVVASVIGWSGFRFWVNALLAAALFASVHVDWTVEAALRGWPTLLVTGLGGLWYAWLLARWQSLWVPMILHAGMNLGWMLASASGGAGGGGLAENLLRAGTIVIATLWTIRRTPRQPSSNDDAAPDHQSRRDPTWSIRRFAPPGEFRRHRSFVR